MELLIYLFIGLIAGIGYKIIRGTNSFGILTQVTTSITGSLLGGYLYNIFQMHGPYTVAYFFAFVLAFAFLILLDLVRFILMATGASKPDGRR
jgi:uncharacterized membrane protein YeaQ/YmgE (transglycosylase-associated protein family)